MTTPPQPEPEALLAHTNYVRALARELVFDSAQARDLEQET
jgi:DNA-directed RNA polymerase specialized sigma24 family protein